VDGELYQCVSQDHSVIISQGKSAGWLEARVQLGDDWLEGAVTKAEAFALLKQAFGLDSVLKKNDSMTPLEGLRESMKYWDWAKDMQDKVPSDGRWWEYENEKTLAYVLMGMFCWRLLGHEDFPPLPDAGPEVRLDSHALLCLWSRSLILDHVHQWVNRGGTPVCGICGEERFDPQPMVGRARRMLREKGG
jgi:hypothetical protein